MSDTQKKNEPLKRSRRCSCESSDSEEESTLNKFANDGSFLDMFKKMQQQNSTNNDNNLPTKNNDATNESKAILEATKPIEAKRKPKVLKVGIIKKKKNNEAEDDAEQKVGSAWDHYMKEVRMYKAKYGDDEDKNRPLVK